MSGYNGYTNHATWCVCLWIDNDEASYNHWRRVAQVALHHHGKAEAVRIIADELRQDHEVTVASFDDLQGSMWADLLNAALSDVNWGEVAATRFDEDAP